MPPVTLDDLSLLHRFAADGDPAAFAELVRRYADLVYATACRVTGSAAAAEDVAQDCFLRLAQRSAEIRGSVAAWLHRTCVNRSLEYRRSESARRRRESSAVITDNDSESAHLIAQVDEALAKLPEELRAVITEHFLSGRSQVDLASEWGVNQSTISRRIEKALVELRERLRADGVVPAVGVLAALLARLPTFPAPATVRTAMNKIGLSGIRGPAPATGWTTALKIAAVPSAAAAVIAIGLLLRAHRAAPRPPARSGVALSTVTSTAPGLLPSNITALVKDADDDGPDDQDDDDDSTPTKKAPAGVPPRATTHP